MEKIIVKLAKLVPDPEQKKIVEKLIAFCTIVLIIVFVNFLP